MNGRTSICLTGEHKDRTVAPIQISLHGIAILPPRLLSICWEPQVGSPLAKNGSLTLVRTSDDDQNCLPRCEFWSGADGSSGGLFIGHIADLVAPPKYLALTRTTGRQAR